MKDADVKIRLMYEEAGRGDVMKNLASLQAEISRLDSSIAKLKTTEKDQSDQTVTDKTRELGILEKLEQQWTDVFVKMRQATTVQDVAKYRTELESLEKQIKDLNGGVEKATTVNKGFAVSLSGLAGLLAAAFSVDAIASFGKGLLDNEVRLESQERAMKTVIKSNTEYENSMAFLHKLSNQYGQDLIEITGAYTKFIASSESSNLSMKERNRIYESIIKAGSALHLGNQEIEGSLLAVSQMFSKGNVSAEELRGQLGERLPGAFGIMAKAMGVSEIQLNKMLEQGQVLAADVLPKFATELEKIYGSGASSNIEGVTGSWNRFKNKITETFDEFNKTNGITKTIASGFNYLADNIEKVLGIAGSLVKTWVAYEVVSRASAVATVALTAIQKANAVAVSALATVNQIYNGEITAGTILDKARLVLTGEKVLANRLLTGATVAMTVAEKEAAVAARAFNASLGIVTLVIGAAVTAYQLYNNSLDEAKAKQRELLDRIGESVAPLKMAQIEFNNLAKEVLNGTLNTQQQHDALVRLKEQYPDILRGVTSLSEAEKILTDKKIATNVQLDYRKAKFDELKAKYPEQLKGIDNLAEAEKKLGAVIRDTNADFQIRMRLMENEIKTDMNKELATNAIKEKIKLEQELQTAKKATIVIGMDGKAIEISNDAAVLKSKIATQTKIIEQAMKFNDNIAVQSGRLTEKLKFEYEKDTANHAKALGNKGKDDDEANKKKKEKAKLTADEVALIELKSNEDSLANRIKIINKQADIEIAQINKTAKNKAEATDRINDILEKKEAEIVKVRLEYNEKVTTAINKLQDVLVEHRRKTGVELVGIDDDITRHFLDNKATEVDFNSKAMKTILKERQKLEDELVKLVEDGEKAQAKARNDAIKSIAGSIPGVSQYLDFTEFQSSLTTSRTAVNQANQQLIEARTAYGMATNIFGESSIKAQEATNTIKKAQVEVQKASNKNAELEQKNATMTYNVWMAVVKAIFNAFSGVYAERAKQNAAMIEMNTRLRDSIVDVYKTSLDASKEAMTKELEMYKGNYEKQKEILSRYLDQQKGLYESKSTYELQINQINRVLEGEKKLNEERSKSFDNAFSWKSLTGQEAKDSALQAAEIVARYYDNIKMMSQKRINDLKFEAEQETQKHQLMLENIQAEHDAFVDAKNAEIDKLKESIGVQIDALKTQRDTARDAIQAQIDGNKSKRDEDIANAKSYYSTLLDEARSKYDAEKEALRSLYDEKNRLLEESTALEIQKVEILDSVRSAALDRWQVTEIKKYEAERDRILATLTDEAEKQQVVDFYAQKVAEVHNQYEDAKLDKSKAINLATIQLKQEEKDKTEQLKVEESEKLKQIEADYTVKVKALADERDLKLKEISDAAQKRETDLRTEMTKQANDYNAKIKTLETTLSDTIKELKQQIANKDIEMNNSMKEENRKYQEYVRRTNKELFAANIQMKVAEMKAEIAMLEGQRTIWNSGKISEQQDRIMMAINELQSISNPYYSIQDKHLLSSSLANSSTQ